MTSTYIAVPRQLEDSEVTTSTLLAGRNARLLAHRPSPSIRMLATSASLVDFGRQHVTRGVGRLTEDVFDKGEGSYVTMKSGRRLLDFTCGIGVTNLGHCHPKISQAAAEQCLTLVHGQCSIAFNEPYLRLIEKLLPMMPDKSLDSFFFWNSGSEAIEGAIKMARVITGRQNVIAMQGGYHGRTFGAMAVTKSKTVYSEGVAPLMPGVFTAPYPYWHHYSGEPATSEEELVRVCLYQVELLLSQQTAPRDTAAILVEPVLGEGGYVPAPTAWLQGLRYICDKHGILLIIDEVQSGFGRTGTNFAIEHSGVKPDIMTIAKGLANGFPLSGIVSRKELTDKLKPGSMGGTYAGSAISCAAGVAVANAFKEEDVLANVSARSKELFASLKALCEDPDVGQYILDVRGRGLMVAMEFASPSHSAFDPAVHATAPKSLASRVSKKCLQKGMLLLTTSVYETIRFIPPLNISQEDMEKGCKIFSEAVREAIAEVPTNDTQSAIAGGLNITDVSKLYLQWFGGVDSQSVSYQLVGSGSNGISKGALVHFSEEQAGNDTTTTPWIALVACDANATHTSLVDDIFTLARDRGAVGAVLYSKWSNACIINAEYANPAKFDQIMDIFSTQSLASARVIEGQFQAINVTLYGTFDPVKLNASQADINATIQAGHPTVQGYMMATLDAYNSTGDPDITGVDQNSTNTNNGQSNSKSGKTTLAMVVLYAITGCVSAMFCIVIITGAIRAIRHPERYRVAVGGSGSGGSGYGNDGRTAVLTRAILDTFPVIKFGRSGTDNGRTRTKDIEAHFEGDHTDASQSLEMRNMEEKSLDEGKEGMSATVTRSSTSDLPDSEGETSAHPRREDLPKLSTDPVDGPSIAVGSRAGPSRQTFANDPVVMPDAIGRETCPICIVDFEEGDDLRVLPCEGHHKFHQTCVDPWLLELSSSCPICRQDFQALETMLSGSTDEGHGPIEHNHSPSSPSQGSRFSRYLRFARRRHRHDYQDPTDPPMPLAPQVAL
ncbi:hypothetical protein EW146_g9204 [Bondarzewia mesenterica]|uniref:RING-type domain-containing protein n=1 Tax=Bondarzewia mesenterica TaxID=1095465 RepID=A0A4S4L8N0_9AGAM|nr:hypothetical protein EW146_g9204 [Bondarzewia mesenterica]